MSGGGRRDDRHPRDRRQHTREELAEAIGHLRVKQLGAVIPSTRAEIGVEIDVLLEAWAKAPA